MDTFEQDATFPQARACPPESLADNILGIDHIAVAAPDLGAAVAWARAKLGCELIEERETQGRHSGMKGATLRLGGLVLVFVEGTGTNSQVTQFVQRHGPGVQHIALRVRNIGPAITALQANDLAFGTPRLDSVPLSQIFSVRDAATGLMVEFIERRNFEGFSDEDVQRPFDSLEEKQLY